MCFSNGIGFENAVTSSENSIPVAEVFNWSLHYEMAVMVRTPTTTDGSSYTGSVP